MTDISNIKNQLNSNIVYNSDSKIYKYVITKYITGRYDKLGKYIPLSYSLNSKLNKNICISTIKFNKIIYENNGIYLDKILSNDKNIIKYPIDKVLQYLLNIFECVEMLQKNNIIHLNIKPESILISDKRAKLSNFEYSIDADTLYTDNETILGIEWRCGDNFSVIMKKHLDYLLLPPELIIYKISNDKKYIKNKYKQYYSIINDIMIKQEHFTSMNMIKKNYIKHYNEYFNILKNSNSYKIDYTKIDIFSLGILLEELIFTYIGTGNIPYNVQSILYDLINLIIDMKRILVKDRININEAISRYKSLLNDMNNYKDINYIIQEIVNNLFL